MKIASLDRVESFVTKDGSFIRELHHTEAQSLAEATLDGQRKFTADALVILDRDVGDCYKGFRA